MSMMMVEQLDAGALVKAFGESVQLQASMARYTAARVGGPADALLEVTSAQEMAETARVLWEMKVPFIILGGGSNVLISDAGIAGVVVLNRARKVRFEVIADHPQVWAESGANFGAIARQAAQRGLSGLEWAAGIPGTLGGAVFGNAGAHGSDMSTNLRVAEILHRHGEIETWPASRFAYTYRSSALKRAEQNQSKTDARLPGSPVAIVLSAILSLETSTPEAVHERMDTYLAHRRKTQPPGASMGSMFKNPPGDYAGRLIEAAGLKGVRIGQAEISALHANFFMNLGGASASDIHSLIQFARQAVADRYGVEMELEIELLGKW
jgi:UDP-N-acetylmuramate dehydrogenase